MRALLMIAVLAVAVPDRPDRSPKEAKPAPVGIQGHWQGIRVIVFGEAQNPMPGEENNTILITGTEFLVLKKGVPATDETMTYTIDNTKKPATIDVKQKPGQMDLKAVGIYKIEGDKLTICLSLFDAVRPTEFVSTAANQTILMEMKRLPK